MKNCCAFSLILLTVLAAFFSLDPDLLRFSPEMVVRGHGYPFQTHRVVTDDGYVLSLYRIPPTHASANESSLPVLFVHGHSINTRFFLCNGEHSMLFALADKGFDVWALDFRGTSYSRGHVSLNSFEQAELYWDFFIEDVGLYDLPAAFRTIQKETGRAKLNYVGYS